MSVFINNLDQNFVKIPNAIITDKRISANEFRLYCYVRSKPGTWSINNKDICEKLSIKTAHTLSKYWKTLIEIGLIRRFESKKVKGKFKGYDYELLPYVGQPHADETIMEQNHNGTNHTLNKTKDNNNTDNKNNTDINSLPETKVSSDNFTKLVIDVHYEWFQSVNDGIPPAVNKAQGAGAKSLSEYLVKIVKKKNPEINDKELPEKIKETLEYIFSNWHRLDKYNQKQTKLSQINSNITNIISDLKSSVNVTSAGKIGRQTEQEITGTYNAFEKAFNQ